MVPSKANRLLLWFMAALLSIALTVMMAVPAQASGSDIHSETTWQEYANKLANSGSFKDVDDLARRLSQLAGNAKTKKVGVEWTTVIVGSVDKYYIGGSQRTYNTNATSGPNAPPTSAHYSEYTVTTEDRDANAISATVFVLTDADTQSSNRITSNVSAGLLSQAGVMADTGQAMNLLSGVIPVVNVLLGLIVSVISVGMTLFSALDILYLSFPAFRSKIDESVEGHGSVNSKGMVKGTKSNKDGSTSSRWVTDDARQAVKDANEAQTQPWGIYFKRRVIAYIFLAIMLFILLTGNIFAITTMITNALSGLFSSLGLG